jgi:osmotically-inducible protein OsmY
LKTFPSFEKHPVATFGTDAARVSLQEVPQMTVGTLIRPFAFGLALALATGSCRNAEKSTVDDASIAASVRHEITKDSELAGYPITVDVMRGNVTLEGRVDRSGQREAAEMLARNVEGVESVSNRILVASNQSESTGGADPSSSNQ